MIHPTRPKTAGARATTHARDTGLLPPNGDTPPIALPRARYQAQ
jgi:hypothetical protein